MHCPKARGPLWPPGALSLGGVVHAASRMQGVRTLVCGENAERLHTPGLTSPMAKNTVSLLSSLPLATVESIVPFSCGCVASFLFPWSL